MMFDYAKDMMNTMIRLYEQGEIEAYDFCYDRWDLERCLCEIKGLDRHIPEYALREGLTTEEAKANVMDNWDFLVCWMKEEKVREYAERNAWLWLDLELRHRYFETALEAFVIELENRGHKYFTYEPEKEAANDE